MDLPAYPEVTAGQLRDLRGAAARVDDTLELRARRACPGSPARALVRTGPAASTIGQTAIDEHVDLVVVGTHGRSGLDRLIVGSVAERVVRVAPCPVLVVKTPDASERADAA